MRPQVFLLLHMQKAVIRFYPGNGLSVHALQCDLIQLGIQIHQDLLGQLDMKGTGQQVHHPQNAHGVQHSQHLGLGSFSDDGLQQFLNILQTGSCVDLSQLGIQACIARDLNDVPPVQHSALFLEDVIGVGFGHLPDDALVVQVTGLDDDLCFANVGNIKVEEVVGSFPKIW